MNVTFCLSKRFGPAGSSVLQSQQLQRGAVLQRVRSPAHGAHGERGVPEVLGEAGLCWEPWLPAGFGAWHVLGAAPARGWFVLAACRLLRD